MSVIALFTWVITILAGLFLLAIWLIEYDPDFQRAAATRLPVPVISSHAVLAICGLGVWVTYLISGEDDFAYLTLGILICVVSLGTTMAVRWLRVYRSSAKPQRRPAPARAPVMTAAPRSLFASDHPATSAVAEPPDPDPDLLVPPERHFPLPVIIGHGLFALTTFILVLLTTLRDLLHLG